MMEWLNKKSRTSGKDVIPIIKEVYFLFKDFEF